MVASISKILSEYRTYNHWPVNAFIRAFFFIRMVFLKISHALKGA
jgi:hypothetical protein